MTKEKERQVLVIGGNGFLGRRTVRALETLENIWPLVGSRSGEYTLKPPGRRKPASTRFARRAASTASEVGALTASSDENPADHAFCTISMLARPLTKMPWS